MWEETWLIISSWNKVFFALLQCELQRAEKSASYFGESEVKSSALPSGIEPFCVFLGFTFER